MARAHSARCQQGALMVAALEWLTEGLLEAAGAWFFFRRRSAVLWLWLGFRALADAACFLLPHNLYQLTDYSQRHIQYLLFAAACTYTAWRILRETKNVSCYVVWICVLMAAAVARLHSVWPLTPGRVLGLETWVELALAGFVAFSLGMANGKAPRPWGLIGCALVVMGGSDGLITLLRQYGFRLEAWYPLGAILGLGMLCWAGWRDYRLEEFRRQLPPKMEPTSIKYEWKQTRAF